MPPADSFDAGTFALVAAGSRDIQQANAGKLHTITACLKAIGAPVYQLQMDLEQESCHHHNSSSQSRSGLCLSTRKAVNRLQPPHCHSPWLSEVDMVAVTAAAYLKAGKASALIAALGSADELTLAGHNFTLCPPAHAHLALLQAMRTAVRAGAANCADMCTFLGQPPLHSLSASAGPRCPPASTEWLPCWSRCQDRC